jgi:hypothetical protein
VRAIFGTYYPVDPSRDFIFSGPHSSRPDIQILGKRAFERLPYKYQLILELGLYMPLRYALSLKIRHAIDDYKTVGCAVIFGGFPPFLIPRKLFERIPDYLTGEVRCGRLWYTGGDLFRLKKRRIQVDDVRNAIDRARRQMDSASINDSQIELAAIALKS